MLNVGFHGAAREVTGSCHRIETEAGSILLDCGLIQGGRERHKRNRNPFPFKADRLNAVVLSHAHIDHAGRLPLLLKAGYKGPIYTTRPTQELCRIMLADSGRIHEEDAKYTKRRLRKRGEDTSWVKPLYTEEDALAAVERIKPLSFDEKHDLEGLGSLRFHLAGHILGAAIVDLEIRPGGETRRVVFSGDLGVEGARLLGPPVAVACPDVLIIESTYGDRQRDEPGDRTELLYDIIDRTVNRGGKLVIPSFAVGRAQELLARINDLVEAGRLEGLPVYVDSPMATAATRVFENNPQAYSGDAQDLLRSGDAPLDFPGLRLVTAVEESMEINRSKDPAIIISPSGMCTAGRIKHHLKHTISDPRNSLLFVGYQAGGSLGQVIQRGTSPIRIFGDWYDVRADVETIEGFSAHADLDELLAWYDSLGGTPDRTFVVHGDEDVSLSFAERLRDRSGGVVDVPERDQIFELG